MENKQIKIITEQFMASDTAKCQMQMNNPNWLKEIDNKALNFDKNKILNLNSFSSKIEKISQFKGQFDQMNQLQPLFIKEFSELNSADRQNKLVGKQQFPQRLKQKEKAQNQLIKNDFEKTYISMLREIKSGDCFQNENISTMKHFFLQKMREMDQKGLLTENERQHINLFINSTMANCQKTVNNSEVNIDIIKFEDSQENYKLIAQENQEEIKREQFGSLSKSKSNNQILNKDHNDITKFMHPKYLTFLNESMRRLKVYKEIKQLCIQKQAWVSQHSISAFIYKLIAIKKLFPQYFQSIIKEFVGLVKQFNKVVSTKAHEIYAKQILSPRYLNCVNMYAKNDNIQPIIYQLYDSGITKRRLVNKIRLFLDFQAKIYQGPYQNDIIKEEEFSITDKQKYVPPVQIPFTADKVKQMKNGKQQLKVKEQIRQVKNEESRLDYTKNKKKGYPTKNFLSMFKFPHRKFIIQNVPDCEQIKEVNKIFSKNWITKEDYCTLYSHPKLHDSWKQMFESKQLYRSLLISRANFQQKKSYVRKIFRFEDAYLTKSFERIN